MAIKKKTPPRRTRVAAKKPKPKLKAKAKAKKAPPPRKVRKGGQPTKAKVPRAGKPSKAAIAAVPENPRALALAHQIANLAVDKKALDVLILDVRGKTSYADYVVIASGESDRQVGATAEAIRAELKGTEGLSPIGSEGFETGNWVLLDYGEVVVHLFLQEARAFYDLEGLWADAAREKVA